MMPELWVLLYSHRQQCFHIETLQETIRYGLGAFKSQSGNDYIVLFMAESQDECHEFRAKIADENNKPRTTETT